MDATCTIDQSSIVFNRVTPRMQVMRDLMLCVRMEGGISVQCMSRG